MKKVRRVKHSKLETPTTTDENYEDVKTSTKVAVVATGVGMGGGVGGVVGALGGSALGAGGGAIFGLTVASVVTGPLAPITAGPGAIIGAVGGTIVGGVVGVGSGAVIGGLVTNGFLQNYKFNKAIDYSISEHSKIISDLEKKFEEKAKLAKENEKHMKYNRNIIVRVAESENKCAICFEDFTESNPQMFNKACNCTNGICRLCSANERLKRCPLCRAPNVEWVSRTALVNSRK